MERDASLADESANVPHRHPKIVRKVIDRNQPADIGRATGWGAEMSCHPLTVDFARHGSLPDFEGNDGRFWADRRDVDPLFGEVAVAVLVGGGVGDPGSKIGDVTGIELAFLVEVGDLVDDPRRLVRERAVGEGGDPGSAGVVDWAGSVSVEGFVDRS